MKRPDGELHFSVGASRSGKTQYVLTQVRLAQRLLVWDVEGEFAAKYGLESVEGLPALVARLRAATGKARIAYHPRNLREFDAFCHAAFAWIIQRPAVIVAEEIAASTSPGKASGYWGVLVSRGLKYGPKIYAIAQRGQEIDKTLLGNATTINICRPNTQQDAEYIAGRFGLKLSDIPDADLEILQRRKDRTTEKLKLYFRQGQPQARKIQKFSRTF